MYEKNVNGNLVSVIVPVYNSEKYLSETLDSILSQSYLQIEVVVVNDCSTDGSEEIILRYMSQFDNISYIKLESNSGVARARNVAIQAAKGRFIAFCDSDDVWKHNKLIEQLKLFENNKGVPFTYTAVEYIDENGTLLKGKRTVREKASYSYLLRNTMISTSTVIVDRAVVTSFSMPLRKSAEDYSLWLSLLKEYGNAVGINEAYTKYRKRRDSLSAGKIKEIKYFYLVQKEDMQIKTISIIINTLCYIINAVKKHFL